MNTEQMLELLAQFPAKEEARERQISVWKYEEVDRLPIIFGVPVPEVEDALKYNFKDCYESKEKMLHQGLFEMLSLKKSPADGCPSIRANTGTGTVATVFGVEQRIFSNTLPWVSEHLSKEEISKLEPGDFDDVSKAGVMPQVLQFQRYFKSKLEGHAGVFLSDTQGPFDNAHLVRGSDILTDVYDDPPFVHHLLELTTAAYITATKTMKENLGESHEQGPHIGGVYLASGAVRCCEDTPVILSPKLIDEFVVPYTQKALAAFGGGYVHYCGRNDHLFKSLAELPEVRGFNLGMPERQDMELVMNTLLPKKKVYYGQWSRNPSREAHEKSASSFEQASGRVAEPHARRCLPAQEGLRDYFARIMKTLGGAKRGLILQPSLNSKDREDIDRVMDIWTEVQNR